jgi:hypothetical protein
MTHFVKQIQNILGFIMDGNYDASPIRTTPPLNARAAPREPKNPKISSRLTQASVTLQKSSLDIK